MLYVVDDLEARIADVQAAGCRPIWTKRFGEGLAASYLEREGDPLLLELFENHHASPVRVQ